MRRTDELINVTPEDKKRPLRLLTLQKKPLLFLTSWEDADKHVSCILTLSFGKLLFYIILRKHSIFRDVTTSFPGKWRLKNKLKVMLMTCHYPDFAPDCMRQIINQSEALPRCGQWHTISVEFLPSFLRRHFAEELVVAWRNISCFLRVVLHCYWCYFCFVFFLSLVS